MPRVRLRRFLLTVVAALLSASAASACTVPVFRYALERWEADRLLVIVYHSGPLAAADDAAIRRLADRSSLADGPLNMEVVRYDIGAPPPNLPGIEPPANQPLPYVEIRARPGSAQSTLRWQGSLTEALAEDHLFDSAARNELVRRLFAGDSAVWLLIAPAGQGKALAEQLQVHLDAVKRELSLPAGIGQPGSELYASIPLEIRFSVFVVSHADAAEQPFLQQLAASAKDWRTDVAYVVPIFGRLRALEVIPYAEVDEHLVRDIGEFLCGACSCRVKQANPGFDLLASVHWNQRLFGDALPPTLAPSTPTGATTNPSGEPEVPQLVAIPSGKQVAADANGPTPHQQVPDTSITPLEDKPSETAEPSAQSTPAPSPYRLPKTPSAQLLLLAVASLLACGIAVAIYQNWHPLRSMRQ